MEVNIALVFCVSGRVERMSHTYFRASLKIRFTLVCAFLLSELILFLKLKIVINDFSLLEK